MDAIFKKNLTVTIFKVSAHSENVLNDHADELAKAATDALQNIPSYTLPAFSFIFQARIIYNSSLPLEINLCFFYTMLYEAEFFEQFISL